MENDDFSADDIAAAQARARRLGRDYTPEQIIALRQSLRTPWTREDFRRMKQSRDPRSAIFSTVEVLAKLASLEAQ
jgi:hypothetical protein